MKIRLICKKSLSGLVANKFYVWNLILFNFMLILCEIMLLYSVIVIFQIFNKF